MKIFADNVSDLGESPLWHSERASLFWLDISRAVIYEKNYFSDYSHADRHWQLDCTPSLIIENYNSDKSLFILTDVGLGELDLLSGSFRILVPLSLPEHMRTNDGAVTQNGNLYFGTMERKPTGKNGSLMCITPKMELRSSNISVGIPNTFAETATEEILYSDSYERVIYKLSINAQENESNVEYDFDDFGLSGTPDGGIFDEEGNLWLASWGSDEVLCLCRGNLLKTISDFKMNQVTSVCFGGPNMNTLFVTSASEGLDLNEERNLNAGKVVMVELENIQGRTKRAFKYELT